MAKRTLPPLSELKPLEYCYAATPNMQMVFRSANGRSWEYWDKSWWSPGEGGSASYYGAQWFRTEYQEWVRRTTKIKHRLNRRAVENLSNPKFYNLLNTGTPTYEDHQTPVSEYLNIK